MAYTPVAKRSSATKQTAGQKRLAEVISPLSKYTGGVQTPKPTPTVKRAYVPVAERVQGPKQVAQPNKQQARTEKKRTGFQTFMDVTAGKVYSGIPKAAGAFTEVATKSLNPFNYAAAQLGRGFYKGLGAVTGVVDDDAGEILGSLGDKFYQDMRSKYKEVARASMDINRFFSQSGEAAEEAITAKTKQQEYRSKRTEGFTAKDLKDPQFWLYDAYGSLVENAPTMILSVYTSGKVGLPASYGTVAQWLSKAAGAGTFSTTLNAAREGESAFSLALDEGISKEEAYKRGERVFRRNLTGNSAFEAIQMLALFGVPQVKIASPFLKALMQGGSILGAGGVEAIQERGEDAVQAQAGSEVFDFDIAKQSVLNPSISKTDVISALMGMLVQGAGNVFIDEKRAKEEFEDQAEDVLSRIRPDDDLPIGPAAVVALEQEVQTNPQGVEKAYREVAKERKAFVEREKQEAIDDIRIEQNSDLVRTALAAGESPAMVALRIAGDAGVDKAVAFVNQVAAEMVQEQEQTKPEEQQRDAPKIEDKTAADIDADFGQMLEAHEQEAADLRRKVDEASARVKAAEPRTNEKKQAKLALEEARKELRALEKEQGNRIETATGGIRASLEKLVEGMGTGLPVGEIVDAVLERSAEPDAANTPLRQLVDEVVQGMQPKKKTPVRTKSGANKKGATQAFDGNDIAEQASRMGTDGGFSDYSLDLIRKENYEEQTMDITELRTLDPDLDEYLVSSKKIRRFKGAPFAMKPIVTSGGEVLDGYNRIAQAIKNGDTTIEVVRGVQQAGNKKPTKKKGQMGTAVDKKKEKTNTTTNGTDNNTGGGDQQGSDAGALRVGEERSGDSDQAASGVDGSDGTAGRGERNDNARKRPSARSERLSNEEIDQIVSAVTQITESGEVLTTGEVTDEVLEAANQYQPGGASKKGRGVLDEYYTHAKIVEMVKSLVDFSTANMRVIEPSVGTGNFLYAIPEVGEHKIAGLEVNPTVARIAKILHPTVKVFNKPFEVMFVNERGGKIKIEDRNLADLILGNPPYGEHRGEYLGLGEEPKIKKYEEYFLKRGIDMLKEGGTLIMVIPSGFLRGATNTHAKFTIPKTAELTEAYRLPNGVFEGTDIGTDIVVFKKSKAKSDKVRLERNKLLNDDAYFKAHPEHVLGTPSNKSGRFGDEAHVTGTLDDAMARFETARDVSKALKTLNDLGIATTPENVETAEAAVEEAGEKAKELVKEDQKAKARGKKTIEKKIVKKATKKGAPVSLSKQYDGGWSDVELSLWKATLPDGSLDMNSPAFTEAAAKTAEANAAMNKYKGKWYLNFNYAQGDIYEKLEQIEREDGITKTKKEEQRKKLLAVLPPQETVEDLRISPNVSFVKDLVLEKDGEKETTLRSAFTSWAQKLPREAFGDSSEWEVRAYVLDEQVRGNDKDLNERVRIRRKRMAESLFTKFLAELSPEHKKLVAESYNRTFNFYHTPDYSMVPMFSEIHATFKGKPFVLNAAQKDGVGRLVNTGVGILAHEVGFGKTISGILAMHETMQRGWAKRPLIVVPSENVYRQWADTINDLIPDAKLNLLGNLGAGYKGDLSELSIPDGSITLVTYEGFKRLSFKDETYTGMADKFKYIADDLNSAPKTERQREKAKQEAKRIGGAMKKGTRADLFFEDLGFDLLTFDEAHNANHIVSKVKLEKGQASEFNRFSLRTSDLGLKTWLASQYIQERTGGRNVHLLSATPFTNHPLEYFSVLSLVADQSLKKMGFDNVNDFFGTFMEAENEYEFKADGTYQKKTDIRRFRNYRQFRKLLDTYIDFKQDAPGIRRPNRVQITYEVPKNELTRGVEVQAQPLFKDKESAGILRAITELRKAAFSPYASKFSAPIAPTQYVEFVENSPKLKTLAAVIAQNKKDAPDAGQIVYSEVGVEFFPMLKQYFVKELGYKADEVEIITGATSKNTRISIQERYNAGKVKILFGSEAISEGMNLQENTTDMHLLSLPWNFTALRQVVGRAWRQGNRWKNVRINQYFIQDSVDVFLSQKLDNKQKRFESALASNASEVDVGDVTYAEMKFDLVQDPETRAKLELQARKDEISNKIVQAKAETAFAARKLEKLNSLLDDIRQNKEFLAQEEERLGTDADNADTHNYWIKQYTKDLSSAEKDYKEELEKLKNRGVDTESLLKTRETGEREVVALEAELKGIDESFADRVKEIAAAMPPRQDFSKATVDAFVAERAQQNKTFYQLAEQESDTVVEAQETVKEVKSVTGKVVKKKKTVTAKRTQKKKMDSQQSTSKDARIAGILGDKNLSITQKVDAILNEKQAGKEFKDVGERVAGSKKERAAIQAIIETGDKGMMEEMLRQLGTSAVADVLDKDAILAETPKPDPEADRESGVPPLVGYIKKELYDRITKTFRLSYEKGKWNTKFPVWVKEERSSRSVTEATEPEAAHLAMLAYPKLLQEFVSTLTAVKTFDDLVAFENWFEETYNDREIGSVDGKTVVVGNTIFGLRVRDFVEVPVGAGYYQKGTPARIHGLMGYEREAIADPKTTKEQLAKAKERLAGFEANINNPSWWDKIKKGTGTREGLDLEHGNFKPLEHVIRTGPAIPDEMANAEGLKERYGFTSVQLGNYMDDATAREHIRHTMGALDDMSEVLNLDIPKIINKMGLSIAFGARGGGRANAHFEPTHKIINLTKSRGDGSFGHEFMHALDFIIGSPTYRGRWSKGKGYGRYRGMVDHESMLLQRALTDGVFIEKTKVYTPEDEPNQYYAKEIIAYLQAGKTFDEAKSEVERKNEIDDSNRNRYYQAIADVYRKEVTGTVSEKSNEYYRESLKVGGGKHTSYWVKSEELWARAFQAYLEDKMVEKGMQNNYLTRTTLEHKAYPQGEERAAINKRFDGLFKALALEGYGREGEAKYRKFDASQAQTIITLTEAGEYLADVKRRLNLDFDAYFFDTILAGYKFNPFTKQKTGIEAWGATLDNTVVLLKTMEQYTPHHEVGHLVLGNLDKIPTFSKRDITRAKLMQAQAQKMGITWSKATDGQIEEAMMRDFEQYLQHKHAPKGILRTFFIWFKEQLVRVARAINLTKGDIVQDYYDILDDGKAVDDTMVRLENGGIIQSFQDGLLDMDVAESALTRFKIKHDGDARYQKLQKSYNDLAARQAKLEADAETWRTDIARAIEVKEEATEAKAAAPGEIKNLARHIHRKAPPVGELTKAGRQEIETSFADPEKAEAEVRDYLKRKVQLVQSRNALRDLRRKVAESKGEIKSNKQTLRDIERRLKMRKRLLERVDFYIDRGISQGKKEHLKIIRARQTLINDFAEQFAIGDKRVKQIIGNRKIHVMTERQFDDFIVEFANKAQQIGNTLTAQDELRALIQEQQFGKWDNVRKAMGLPVIEKMKEGEAVRLLNVLAQYQFGDVFLTQRMLETIHRTDWGEMRTEREMYAKMEEVLGFGAKELSKLESPPAAMFGGRGSMTPWIKLARLHPFYNWLVGRRVQAELQATQEYVQIERVVNELARKARASRRKRMGIGARVVEAIVPTDEIVFGYLEASDKITYAKEKGMTAEERTFGDYLILQYHNAYMYLRQEHGMTGRKDYMTHMQRTFLEAIKDGSLKEAWAEMLASQKEEEASFKILEEQTGEVLAFEKFFRYALRRTGEIKPTQNVARAVLGYYGALTKKRALDSLVPEAMVATHAYEILKGKTARGLEKDQTVTAFVKRFVNDAKGRRISGIGWAQGSDGDVRLRMFLNWISFKYLGFNLASAIANIFGDFAAVSLVLTNKELARGITRSFDLKRAGEINTQYQFFTGRNPFVEIADPRYNLPQRFWRAAMSFMAIASFQSQKFFLRAKMSDEEWRTGVVEHESMVEIANALSRVKPNPFYVKSLAGNTTLGSGATQFMSWAFPIWNSTTSDAMQVLAMLKEMRNGKKTWGNVKTTEEWQYLSRTVLRMSLLGALAMLLAGDDEDDTWLGQLKRKTLANINTGLTAIVMPLDPANYALAWQELMTWWTLLTQLVRIENGELILLEEYKRDGAGYEEGDLKSLNTAARIITPSIVRQLLQD